MVLYLDILVAVNWIIDCLLLRAAARCLRLSPPAWRTVLAGGIGALCAALAILPAFPEALTFPWQGLTAFFLTAVAFGGKTFRVLVRRTLCFYGVSFTFSGILYGIWYLFSPPGMLWRNGVVYAAVSPLLLIGLTVTAYGILWLFRHFREKRLRITPKECCLTIHFRGNTVTVSAFPDTGNGAREPISGAPVLIAEYEAVRDLLSPKLRPLFENFSAENLPIPETGLQQCGFRLVPISTVAGSRILPAFFPDSVRCGEKQLTGICVAVYPQKLKKDPAAGSEYHALLPGNLWPFPEE